MAKATPIQRIEMSLRSFYIFNPKFYKKEGDEHKKILYFHPRDEVLDTKIKDVGLSEAIISFIGIFSDEDCKTVNTQKTTQIFYQPEPGYWMVLVINVPKEIQMKDGVEVPEYCGAEVHEKIYRAVLEKCYNMFRLLEGTFQMNFDAGQLPEDEAREQLQKCLEVFFDKYLPTLRIPVHDTLDLMRSIQYLPLNKTLFLRAHNFLKMIQETFPIITETILMYNEQIVCSGKLNPIELYSLHEHILDLVLGKATHSNGTAFESSSSGSFINGPEARDEDAKSFRVYLKNDHELRLYCLVIYTVANVTFCAITPGDQEPQSELYTELQSYMGPLNSLAVDIKESLTKPPSGPKSLLPTGDCEANGPKYIFVNEQSLKHLTNINMDKRRNNTKTAPNMSPTVMNVIADLWDEHPTNSSMQSEGNDSTFQMPPFKEVQVKATNDFWIVKRSCNWRQYFVIIFNSKATLIDVTNEAKRIFDQELTDDVFLDK